MPERTIPILPCQSIDDVLAFYSALGFEVTYRQERPNVFAAIARGTFELQFFVLRALEPADSYSTCYVLTDDVDALYEAFTKGLRSSLGRVPQRGIPRIGPLRDMTYGVRQFIVVDPGGNYVRIGQPIESKPALRREDAARLERSLEAAVTLADSRGDAAAAAKVLDAAIDADPDAPADVRVRAFVLRADVAWRTGDADAATRWLADARAIELAADERALVADELRRADELSEAIPPG